MKSLITTLTLSLGLVIATTAQASLVDRGGGLIYDTDLNITWLADANVNGLITWDDAMTWASDLSYYDSVRDVTYTDWRLPTTLQPDPTCNYQSNGVSGGFNCTGSEMGHLFYTELGGTANSSILSSIDPDVALFMNIQSDSFYWSGTALASNSLYAWVFFFNGGAQDALDKGNAYGGYAWAVHSGDVAAVPVPGALWLFGSGLIGLAAIVRRKKEQA